MYKATGEDRFYTKTEVVALEKLKKVEDAKGGALHHLKDLVTFSEPRPTTVVLIKIKRL